MAKLVVVVNSDFLVDLDIDEIVVVQAEYAEELVHWHVEDTDYEELMYEAMLAAISKGVEH